MEHSAFRRSVWDPVLILAQIVTLQCFGYGAFSVLMLAAALLGGVELSPRLLFDCHEASAQSVHGLAVLAALVCMGAANVVPLVYMVERSRLCVDFTLTFYAVHVILVWWGFGAPTVLAWWAAVAAGAAAMALGGRAACLRRELLPIAIRGLMPARPAERARADEEHELEARYEQPHFEPPEQHPEPSGQPEHSEPPRASSGSWSNDDWGVVDAPEPPPKGHKND